MSDEPRRIQRKRTKGWHMPDNCVYVGRPSKWGNPFTGDDAVERYREAVSINPITQKKLDEWTAAGGDPVILFMIANHELWWLEELRGKDLACWCPPDKKCHADILLGIVNEAAQSECDRRNNEKRRMKFYEP